VDVPISPQAGAPAVYTHVLNLPPALKDYRVRVGLYQLETGQRLPVVNRGGDSIELLPSHSR
jgi:hypothetical protein